MGLLRLARALALGDDGDAMHLDCRGATSCGLVPDSAPKMAMARLQVLKAMHGERQRHEELSRCRATRCIHGAGQLLPICSRRHSRSCSCVGRSKPRGERLGSDSLPELSTGNPKVIAGRHSRAAPRTAEHTSLPARAGPPCLPAAGGGL